MSAEVNINNVNDYNFFDAINQRYWNQRASFDNFNTNPVTSKVGGGAATGVAGDNNVLATRFGIYEWFVIGTQTILAPKLDAFGLNLASQDATAGDGIELCQGVTSLSVANFLIGTAQPFFFRTEFQVQDVSGCNPLIIGWRKVQDYDATLANYTDFVSVGIVAGDIVIQTQKSTGGVVTTDTTQNAVDGAVIRFAIYVEQDGTVTYTVNDSPPVVTAAYQFNNALNVIPFVRFTQGTDITTQASCDWYEIAFTPEPFVA